MHIYYILTIDSIIILNTYILYIIFISNRFILITMRNISF